ncbi:MAG TPA: patatin-like phospholipase family protein [Candidatus Omnitrophota bacterium]|nr:patatin-like phospholipase family protein [Candidatus Omnitrophota bacterium]HPD85162.1 patatin-like phospholipase family protein [Candidatus Omnitrophota bacterium]HRZ04337.1 patatin-like phospholipase family protein [Candidatus Omnitrophota bacterium]
MGNFSTPLNKIEIIKQLPVFGKLGWFEWLKIAGRSNLTEYKKGEIICREGSPADAFYCLVSGRIQAYTIQPNGQKQNVEFIHRGMYFGIISLLTGEGHSLTFEAMNDSLILRIEKADFSGILDSIPRLAIEFSRSLSRRLRSRESPVKLIFESTVIAVYGAVKASGSSTHAINLALNLERETGKKVILVNISSVSAGTDSGFTSGLASPRWKKEGVELKNIVNEHQKIVDNISRWQLKIDLLKVVFDPSDSWLISQISHFVSFLANNYHYVVVDLPNEMDDVVLKTLTQSDVVHLVAHDRQEDLKSTRQVLDRLRESLGEKFSPEKNQVIISNLGPKGSLSTEEITRALDYKSFKLFPHISQEDLEEPLEVQDIMVPVLLSGSVYAQATRRMARQIGGVLVGLVLGGGAALGIAHIGVIRVLEKEGIPIDVVVGSSIGALIASLWVAGKNADEIELIAREFGTRASMSKLLDFTISKGGFVSGHNITRWLRRHLGDKTFYDTRLPFMAVAYDLLRREEMVIEQGSLVDAVRQSIAIPGVITPITRNGRLIIDGGVVNPLPTNVVASLGIKRIIAVNVLQTPYDVIRGYEALEKQRKEDQAIPFFKDPLKFLGVRAGGILRKLFYPNIPDIIVSSLQAVDYVIAEQSAQQADVLIHPDLAGINWFEFYYVDRMIKQGEEAAYRHLDSIKKLIREHP